MFVVIFVNNIQVVMLKNLFYSISVIQNKLECLSLASFYRLDYIW